MRAVHCRRAVQMAFAAVVTLIVLPSLVWGADTYKPIDFNLRAPLVLNADPRLDPLLEGTIELWLAMNKPETDSKPNDPKRKDPQPNDPENKDPKPDDPKPKDPKPKDPEASYTVAAHGDLSSGVNWKVVVRGDRKSISMEFPYWSNPKRPHSISAACDFTDGKFHHVAFVLLGDEGRVFVDGTLKTAVLLGSVEQIGFAPPIWPGKPLFVGGGNAKDGFPGSIRTLRIWNKGFVQMQWAMASSFGLIEDKQVSNHLIAYSHFTEQRQEVFLTKPRIFLTDFVGSPIRESDRGSLFFLPYSEFYKFNNIAVKPNGQNFTFGVDYSATWDKARFALPFPKAGATIWRGKEASDQDIVAKMWPGWSQLRVGSDPIARICGYYDENGIVGRLGFAKALGRSIQEDNGFRHVGIKESEITFIEQPGKNANETPFAPAFCLTTAPNSDFAGLVAKLNPANGKLMSLAMAYTISPAPADQSQVDRLRYGRWVDQDEVEPRRDDQRIKRIMAQPVENKDGGFDVIDPLEGELAGAFIEEIRAMKKIEKVSEKDLREIQKLVTYEARCLRRTRALEAARDKKLVLEQALPRDWNPSDFGYTRNLSKEDSAALDDGINMITQLALDKRGMIIFGDRRSRFFYKKVELGPEDTISYGEAITPDFLTQKIDGLLTRMESNLDLNNKPVKTTPQVQKHVVRKPKNHSAYTGMAIYRFTYRRSEPGTLYLHVDQSSNFFHIPTYIHENATESNFTIPFFWNGTEWQSRGNGYGKDSQNRLIITDDRVRIIGPYAQRMNPDGFGDVQDNIRTLVRVPEYEEPADADGKAPWGGTFSLEQRPMLVNANFRGYNILRMDPRDCQSSGTHKSVFKFPAEASKDYFFSEGKMAVPYGLLYRSANEGKELANTQTLQNSSEYKQEWTASAGVSLDCPFAHGSLNVSYGEQSDAFEKHNLSCTTTRTRETRHVLVLDKRHMELDPEFKGRVEELRSAVVSESSKLDDFMAKGNVPDRLECTFGDHFVDGPSIRGKPPYRVTMLRSRYLRYEKIFDAFGTHYTHSVTYGGMAVGEMFHTETEKSTMFGSSFSIHATASAAFEGFGGGLSGGYDSKQSDTLSNMVANDRVKFRTYGGSLSKGQGWAMARGEEVPLKLDLRPIHELLSPIFFDDPYIWKQLREEMNVAYIIYICQKGNKGQPWKVRDCKELQRRRGIELPGEEG